MTLSAPQTTFQRDAIGDVLTIARRKVDEGATGEARRGFRESLRHARGLGPSDSARALAWIAVLSLPDRVREQAGGRLVTLSRGVDDLLGIRQGAPS